MRSLQSHNALLSTLAAGMSYMSVDYVSVSLRLGVISLLLCAGMSAAVVHRGFLRKYGKLYTLSLLSFAFLLLILFRNVLCATYFVSYQYSLKLLGTLYNKVSFFDIGSLH